MSYTINPNAKNKWARNAENTMDLSLETDASSVYLDNGRTLEQEIGEGSMVSNIAIIDSAMSKVIDGTLDGFYESGVMYGKTMVNIMKPVEDITKVGNGTYSGFHLNESGLIKNLKTDTDYLFVVHVKSNTLTGSTTYSLDFGNTDPNNPNQQACFITRQHLPHDALGTYKFIMRTRDSFDGMAFVSRNQLLSNATGGSITFNYMVLEYQEGMENWDIPFFGGICDVKMPILRNVGKNLFDKNTMKTSWWINQSGVKKDSGNTNYSILVPATQNKVYSVSFDVANRSFYAFLDKDYNTLLLQTGYVTKTAPQGTKYLLYYLHNENIDLCGDIQLEEATAKTAHEDYKTNILRTPETLTLRSLPNGVRDELNVMTGEYVQRIGEVVLDGSEDWSVNNSNNEGFYSASTTTYVGKPKGAIISDKLPTITTTKAEGVMMGVTTGKVMVSFNRDSAGVSNINSFVEKLAQNPLTVQYELVEPITTIVEPLTTPFAYENGHTILESGYEGQSLLPTLEYSTVVNKTGLIENVAKTIQRQEKQLTMLEKMLIQNIINLDYNNTLLTLKNEMEEML